MPKSKYKRKGTKGLDMKVLSVTIADDLFKKCMEVVKSRMDWKGIQDYIREVLYADLKQRGLVSEERK